MAIAKADWDLQLRDTSRQSEKWKTLRQSRFSHNKCDKQKCQFSHCLGTVMLKGIKLNKCDRQHPVPSYRLVSVGLARTEGSTARDIRDYCFLMTAL